MSDFDLPVSQRSIVDLYPSLDHQSYSTTSDSHNPAIFDHSYSFIFESNLKAIISNFHKDYLI